jgi:uncharacterized cupin superfamily protein
MATIFQLSQTKFALRGVPVDAFNWHTSERLSDLAGSKRLIFDFRSLDPGKFSFPYHFHHNAEELFYVISGACSLRTPEGIRTVKGGDLIHMSSDAYGAHQLYNHTGDPCVYLDIRTFDGTDIAEYPDSGKIGTLPGKQFYEKKKASDYFEGEMNPLERWNETKGK